MSRFLAAAIAAILRERRSRFWLVGLLCLHTPIAIAQRPLTAFPLITGTATAADVTRGTSVFGTDGNMIGQIETLDSGFVILATKTAKVRVPLSSFNKTAGGVSVALSAAQIDRTTNASSLSSTSLAPTPQH